MADLKVAVGIELKDGFSPEARKAGAASERLSQAVGAGQRKLDELGKRGESIQRLRELGKDVRATSAQFDAAAKKTAALRRELKAAEAPSKKLERAFEASKRQTAELGRSHARQRDELRRLRRELREAGVETGELGRAQRSLADDVDGASRKLERMRQLDVKAQRSAQRAADAGRAWDNQRRAFAEIALAAQGVSHVGRRLRQFGLRPIELARPVAAQQGRLAQLGMNADAIATVTSRGRQVMRELPGVDTERFLGAAYDINSAIAGLDARGVAGVTEMAALASRSADSSPEAMARLFAQGWSTFRGQHGELSDREFAATFGAQVTAAAQAFRTTGTRWGAQSRDWGRRWPSPESRPASSSPCWAYCRARTEARWPGREGRRSARRWRTRTPSRSCSIAASMRSTSAATCCSHPG